ncbi:tandem-95 repeat protein [Teredinibacter turnerae]|uniref:tandem-95 repeat protein n=1 Tax=Teredinibacter turnerae TaxID=2426 RepID=UPI00035F7ED6|nr:tandem-95 repeat protein [Teredinibacter turnerae]
MRKEFVVPARLWQIFTALSKAFIVLITIAASSNALALAWQEGSTKTIDYVQGQNIGVIYIETDVDHDGHPISAVQEISGSHPPGVNFHNAGPCPSSGKLCTAYSGTPTSTAVYTVTIRATDGADTADMVITWRPALSASGVSQTTAIVGSSYSSSITPSGGVAPYVYAVTSGSLPAGMILNTSTGAIDGTPTTVGAYPFTVTVTDTNTTTATATQTINVYNPLSITTTTLVGGRAGSAYSATLASTGGDGSDLWSVTAGSLPTGLSLNSSTGVISGTPSTEENASFTVSNTCCSNLTNDTQSLSIAVLPQFDSDGDLLTGAAAEATVLNFSADTSGEAIGALDFILRDGGATDALPLTVSQVVLHVSGTSTDAERGNIRFVLNGPDVIDAIGTYSALNDTVTFSSLGMSITDGNDETYAVSAYVTDASSLTHGHTVILSLNGDTDLSVGGSDTQMGTTSAVNNGSGFALVDDIAPAVVSVSVPANATYIAGSNLDFTVNFSETVAVDTNAGTPRLALTVGSSTRYANYLSGSGSAAVVFRYSVQSGDLDTDGVALAASLDLASGSISDGVGNGATTTLASVGSLAGVLVDAVLPQLAETTAVAALGNDASPSVTFTTDEAGTLAVGGSCGSASEGAITSGSHTITLLQSNNVSDLVDGTYSDCSLTVTDAAGNSSASLLLSSFEIDLQVPGVSELTQVVTPGNDSTPNVTLTLGEAGILAVGGSCGSSDEGAVGLGNTTITLTQTDNTSPLADGTYSDCTVTVTDAAGNVSTPLTLSSFLVDTLVPVLAEVSQVTTPSNNTAPGITISSSEAGNLSVGGSCGSASEGAVTSGNTALVLTQPDNTSALADGTYADCAVTVADASGNISSALTLSSFTIDATPPTLATNLGVALTEGDTGVAVTASALSATDNLSAAGQVTFTLTAAASNGTLYLSGNALAANGTFTQADLVSGILTYDHDGGETTSDTVAFTLADALGNVSAPLTFAFTVAPSNDAPLTSDDSATTNEDTPVTVDVLANDFDSDDAINAASVIVVTQPMHGSTSVNTVNGKISYTPATDYYGSDSFAYTVQDQSTAVSTSAVVAITVTSINDIPVASDDTGATIMNVATTIDVAANDSDVDLGDAPDVNTIVIVSPAAHGTAVVNAGKVDYTPNLDFFGADSFTYTIADSNSGVSAPATVSVSVIDPNTAPTAVDDSVITAEDTAQVIDVLANDRDDDGTLVATSVNVVAGATHGTAVVDATTGRVTYTPAANYFGTDSFSYTVRDDDDALSAAATVSITVTAVNDAPVAANDVVVLLEDASLSINVLGNDTDIDGTLNSATISIVDEPASGMALFDNGTIMYTPFSDYAGDDSFTYTVQDNNGLVSNMATVSLSVTAVNDAPVAADDSFAVVTNGASLLNVLVNDSDVDGTLDIASIIITVAPTQGTLVNNNDGSLSYTPNSSLDAQAGDSFAYTVDDDAGTVSSEATVSLSFKPAAAPAIGGAPETEVLEAQVYSFTPEVTVGDANFPLTFSATGVPSWMTFSSETGTLTGTPALADVGTHTGIVIGVSDGFSSQQLPAFSVSVIDAVDSDGDTLTDYQEGVDGTDPTDSLDYRDVTAPELNAPADIIVDATGLFTDVSLQQLLSLAANAEQASIDAARNALATDNVDGSDCCNPVAVNLQNGKFTLAPGLHTVQWRAEDFMGNSSVAQQQVYVRPLVSLSKNQFAAEGATVTVKVLLNGEAPVYPFTVPYVIDSSSTADSADHSLQNGTVTFEDGETEVAFSFTTVADGVAEGDETLVVRLDDRTSDNEDLLDGFDADMFDVNAGTSNAFQLTLQENNVAPTIALQLIQNNKPTILVQPSAGEVVITADVTDTNVDDTYRLVWSSASLGIDAGSNGDELRLGAADLSLGVHKIKVQVTDAAGASSSASLNFNVVSSLPVLSGTTDSDGDGSDDASEGTGDADGDGIADYLDNISLPNVLPEVLDDSTHFLMECDPGVRCRLGEFAMQQPQGGSRLASDDLVAMDGINPDPNYNMDFVFDFDMEDLPLAGQEVSVVIPQISQLPAGAVYRKFTNGQWRDFVEDANNRLHSAPGSEGLCPPPGDAAYRSGLNQGDWCVQLTIEDGGPNDADGEANNAVVDPGGVGTQNTRKLHAGGGSFGAGLLVLLLMAVALRAFNARALPIAALVFAVGLLPQHSRAQEQPIFVEASLLQTSSSQDESGFIKDLSAEGIDAKLDAYDADSSGYLVKVGIQFTPHFSGYVGFVDLGEGELDMAFPAEDDDVIEDGLRESFAKMGNGVVYGGRAHVTPFNRVNVYADLGIYTWKSKVSVSGSDISASTSGVDPFAGVGCTVDINDKVALGLTYNYFKLDDQRVSAPGISLTYTFN